MIKHLAGYGTSNPFKSSGEVQEKLVGSILSEANTEAQEIRNISHLFEEAESICSSFAELSSWEEPSKRFACWKHVSRTYLKCELYLSDEDDLVETIKEVRTYKSLEGAKRVSSWNYGSIIEHTFEKDTWKGYKIEINFHLNDNGKCRIIIENEKEIDLVKEARDKIEIPDPIRKIVCGDKEVSVNEI